MLFCCSVPGADYYYYISVSFVGYYYNIHLGGAGISMLSVYIHTPVVVSTGSHGAPDMTLSFFVVVLAWGILVDRDTLFLWRVRLQKSQFLAKSVTANQGN